MSKHTAQAGKASSLSGFIKDTGQDQKILERLQGGEWVSALDLAAISLQYCARIHSLRKKLAEEGVFVLENKLEISEDCKRRGWYRLTRIQPEELQSVLFPSPTPAKWTDPEEGCAR